MPKEKELGPKEIGSLKKYYEEYKTELVSLDNEINQTDLAIDGMVYELYGLTKEEKDIIKGIGNQFYAPNVEFAKIADQSL